MSTYRRIRRAIRLAIDRVPIVNRRILVSAGYRILPSAQAGEFDSRSSAAWSRAARRQEKIYDRLLVDMRAGRPRIDFKVAAEAVEETRLQHPRLLEVGCGNGYYSEILARLCKSMPSYVGLDYSSAMIESARRRYPGTTFVAGDTTALPFRSSAFDIVMDGVSLTHIRDYPVAIREIGRIAKRFAILHCVPTFDSGDTVFLSKYAYGQPVFEVVFGPGDVVDLCRKAGLEVCRSWDTIPYDVVHVAGRHSRLRTFLLRKVA